TPRRSQQDHELAVADVQADVVDGDGAITEHLGYALERDGGHASPPDRTGLWPSFHKQTVVLASPSTRGPAIGETSDVNHVSRTVHMPTHPSRWTVLSTVEGVT